MKKILMLGNYKIALMVFGLVMLAACKKYKDTPPYFEPEIENPSLITRKVLFIGIDGLVGSEMKLINPTNIEGMKAHGKYSYDGVSDEISTDAASWKTLMSGVSFSKHHIQDSTFIYTPVDPSINPHVTQPNYPSIFSYILSSTKPDLNTVFISSWADMVNKLVPEVERPIIAANDAAAKDSAKSVIVSTNAEFVTVNFNEVAKAGLQYGFSASVAGYKDAVNKVDGYIGELLSALKAKAGYNKTEEWLVIVAGTHGGINKTYGGRTTKETNVFSLFYSENFLKTEFTKEGSITTVTYSGRDASAIKAETTDPSLYNPRTGEYTFQIRIKSSNSFNYPHFISKSDKFTSPGWTIFTNSTGTWALSIKSVTGAEKRIQGSAGMVFDNKWHTLTFVIYDSAGGKYVKRFTDGVRVDADPIANRTLTATYGDIVSSQPLRLGWGSDVSYNGVTFSATDMMIFNTSLTDDEVKTNLCLQDVTKHPKYASLTGYWPLTDGFGGQMNNEAPGATMPLTLMGAYSWTGISDLTCNRPALTGNTKVSMLVKNVDIPANIFYWVRISVSAQWKQEGTSWLQNYESEFVKL